MTGRAEISLKHNEQRAPSAGHSLKAISFAVLELFAPRALVGVRAPRLDQGSDT